MCERNFSSMRQLKSWRCIMLKQHSINLSIINIEDLANKNDSENILNLFVSQDKKLC